ncbi:MAG: ABC transporter ATP-binding protein [Candidatus Dormibacteria bacterium]
MTAAVELQSARKSYGQVEALKGVDLAIQPGELVAILGPNGAGKTTAISLMLGLRRPSAGTARLFGLDPTDRRARSRCGVMLQESGVADVLTIRETIDLFRAYYPAPMPVERALSMAGLVDEQDRQVGKLSGGQRQRLYYALAVCGNPEVLFLDEPTVGMDVESRRSFLDGIQAFYTEGKTIVLTTHYLEEADELARRVVVIAEGVVIADASPAEIKAKVQGRRVTFVSDANLTEGDFAGLPVSRLELDGARVKLLSNHPEDLLRELFKRGLAIQDLTVVGADLEEAFLSLTSKQTERMEALA